MCEVGLGRRSSRVLVHLFLFAAFDVGMVSRCVYRTPLTGPYPLAVLLPELLPLATFGAIVVVSGHRHSHATSGDSRVRGLVPGELVNEHVDGRGIDLLEIEGAVAVALLPKKIVLLRKAPEDDVFDEVIRNLLPHVLQAYPQVCLLYTSPSPRDATLSSMPSSA